MALSTNIAPYYNDFDPLDNYHQILFKPGLAVQTRELTQIQSILRNQIEQFGNHIFKQGSVVIPGNTTAKLGVPYIKLERDYNSAPIDPTVFLDKTIVGSTTGVSAIVTHVELESGADPITLYLSYQSGGVIDGEPTEKVVFEQGEDIYLFQTPETLATILNQSGAVGVGSIAYINRGVYYVNGTFVTVNSQQTVMSKYTVTPSCHVLLKITESIVTSDEDESLLDPAQSSYNFAAPGADRLKITLTLTTLPLGSTINDDYVELMRYREGVLEEHLRNARYNELDKALARRTFDESGNYVVSGLDGEIVEHLKVGTNGGVSTTGSRNNYAIKVTPGKAYINGFETEKIANTVVVAPKARTAAHVKLREFNQRPTFGRYIYVSGIVGGPRIDERQIIELYDDNDASNGSATKVGEARVLAIDYHIGDPASTNAIYKLWVTDVTFTTVLVSMEDVGGIRYTGGSAAVIQVLHSPLTVGTHNIGDIINHGASIRTATVRYWDVSKSDLYVFKHDHTKATPKVGDQIVNATTSASSVVLNKTIYVGAGVNSALFVLPVDTVKSLRNGNNVYDYRYTTQRVLTIATNASGNGSASIAVGTIRTPEVGTFAAFGPAGVVSTSLFSLNIAGNTLTLTGGPASTTVRLYVTVDKSGTIPKTKTLTNFIDTVTVAPGATTALLSKADVYRIVSIADDTGNVTANYELVTGQTDFAYYRSSVRRRPGAPAPVGNLVITYDYFLHTAGDFCTFDSYANNTGYEDFVLYHTSESTGVEYNLKNCIDCRPIVNSANDFGSGALVGDMFVSGELFTSSIQYYVPRYDVLVMDVGGDIKLIQGTPDDNPSPPVTPIESLDIEQYFVPAYTDSVLDIKIKRLAVDRYTMKDISDISDRVGRLEEFSTLNAAESSVVNYDVVDAETGLSRFKTGYLVESFNTPLTVADIYDTQFAAAFDQGSLVPSAEEMDCPVTLLQNQSSGYQVTNGIISLPYTEARLISQPLSSRVTNINPFLVIRWDGVLTVTPNRDSWVEVLDLPTIVINRTEVVTTTRWVDFPGGPTVFTERREGTTVMPSVVAPFFRTQPVQRGGKIICTKLYELGFMDFATYEADQMFGEHLASVDPVLMEGYHRWANVVVDWMGGEGIHVGISRETMRKLSTRWAIEIATPWAQEMAYQMGVDGVKSSRTGKLIMAVGKVASRFIGKYDLMKSPTALAGVGMVGVFAILRLVAFFGNRK